MNRLSEGEGVRSTSAAAGRPTSLAQELASKALCETDHPARAVAALMGAAAEILCARFPAEVAAALIAQVAEEALALTSPAGHA